MKPTPGPWYAEVVGSSNFENPDNVCEITNGYQRVAEYVLEQDACLIAAAPELLAALQGLLKADAERNECPGFASAGNWLRANEAARAAIAKVKPEAARAAIAKVKPEAAHA